MQSISEAEILGKLDPLNEYEGLVEHLDPITGKSIYRRVYYSSDLYISTYASESDFAIDAIWEVYDVLNNGAGNFLKAFKKDNNTLVLSWPRFKDDKYEDATYTLMIEEITRIAAWLLKTFGLAAATKYIENYIKTCISA